MNTRELKALDIAARRRLTFVDGVWTVPSQTSATPYKVKFAEAGNTCTCEDWELHHEDCKHIIAARLVAEREGRGTAPAIDTDSLPPKKQDKRDWAVYRDVRFAEKSRFLSLLYQLCQAIPDPPYIRGRPRTPLADVVFACIYKVYSRFPTDRFATDLFDAVENGYMTRPMHPNKVNTHLEDPDLTPVLRKLIEKSSLPFQGLETIFAPDATGFSVSRNRRWFCEKDGRHRKRQDWIKAHVIIGVKTHIVTAVELSDADAHDHPFFKPLLEATAKNFRIEEVVADKGYLSRENFELVESYKGRAFIPFKNINVPDQEDNAWDRAYYMFHLRSIRLSCGRKLLNAGSFSAIVDVPNQLNPG